MTNHWADLTPNCIERIAKKKVLLFDHYIIPDSITAVAKEEGFRVTDSYFADH